MADLTMPRLSDTMEEGTLGRWLKQEGDSITRGEIIAEIQTDKANMELEAFENGVLEEILVQEGETVPVGERIAVIGDGSGKRSAERETTSGAKGVQQAQEEPVPEQTAPVEQPTQPAPEPATEQSEPVATGSQGRLKSSPMARRLAQEFGLDLSQIRGTGPNGRIKKEDVEKARDTQAQAQPAAQEPVSGPQGIAGEIKPFTRLQKIVAQRVAQSKAEVPHIYVTTEIDMDAAIELRQEINAMSDVSVSFNDIVVKACALALRKMPIFNASYAESGIKYNTQINIGIAVALEAGLTVPVIRDTDKKMLRDVAAEAKGLIQKARENKLGVNDLSGGTFSVSNMGMYGVTEFAAIINQPESAILAVGAIEQKPVIKDGEITVGKRMRVTLSADHRVHNGADAAQFLREIKQLLEFPLALGF